MGLALVGIKMSPGGRHQNVLIPGWLRNVAGTPLPSRKCYILPPLTPYLPGAANCTGASGKGIEGDPGLQIVSGWLT